MKNCLDAREIEVAHVLQKHIREDARLHPTLVLNSVILELTYSRKLELGCLVNYLKHTTVNYRIVVEHNDSVLSSRHLSDPIAIMAHPAIMLPLSHWI